MVKKIVSNSFLLSQGENLSKYKPTLLKKVKAKWAMKLITLRVNGLAVPPK